MFFCENTYNLLKEKKMPAGIRSADEHGGAMLVALIISTHPFIPAMIARYLIGGKKWQGHHRELTAR